MNYCKSDLEMLNIFALRELAYELNVKAPTTLNKKQLIDEILNITTTPNKKPSKRGRPRLNTSLYDTKIEKTDVKKEEIIDELLEKLKQELLNLL